MSFAPITSAMNLQELRITGYDHEGGFEGEINMQFLDSVGRTDAKYFWYDIPADPDDPDSVAFYGWYDGDDELVEDLTITPGQGFWLFSDSKEYSLQSAGQIITNSTAITLLDDGLYMVANPLPQDISLQEIAVGGYPAGDGFEGEINVQFLDTLGNMASKYFWYDIPADPDDQDSAAFYGWYDGNDEFVEDVIVGAGTALWTFSDSSAYSLVFPGVNLN